MNNTLSKDDSKDLYTPYYSIMSSFTIKKKYRKDYQELLLLLKDEGISKGEYLVNAYRELDKPSWSKYLKQTQHTK